MDIFEKIKSCKTMPELDNLRLEVVQAMEKAGKERGENGFSEVQRAFIKQKNKLKRIPLRDRNW